jgi:2-iminobutanoate/2-iminopropanoate deaminase
LLGGLFLKEVIFTNGAPAPGLSYSQAIKVGNIVYVAAQGPFDPETGKLVGKTFEVQTRRALENMKAILEESGAKLSDVVKVTVNLGDGAEFNLFNQIYNQYFTYPYPARTITPASMGPIMVQIDVIAHIS